jgi:predicted nuclease of predicted toxin-antitoxin system
LRLLLDHCVPQRLRDALAVHDVSTAAQMQWDRLRNGALLAAAAAAGFDAVITVDQNLKHQQNVATLPIAVIVIVSRSNEIDQLTRLAPLVLTALRELKPRRLIELRE